jgi:hypothetical protein
MSAPLVTSEKLHLASLLKRNPCTITLNGRNLPAAFIARRGVRYENDGGVIQSRTIKIVVASALLPAADIIDATTDATRAVRFTHVETGRVYQLATDAGAPNASPHGVFWTLTGNQITSK